MTSVEPDIINEFLKGKEADPDGIFPQMSVGGVLFYVAAGPNRGSFPKERKGPWTHLELVFPSGRNYLEAYEKIYGPIRGMTNSESLRAPCVPVEDINKMIKYYGGRLIFARGS